MYEKSLFSIGNQVPDRENTPPIRLDKANWFLGHDVITMDRDNISYALNPLMIYFGGKEYKQLNPADPNSMYVPMSYLPRLDAVDLPSRKAGDSRKMNGHGFLRSLASLAASLLLPLVIPIIIHADSPQERGQVYRVQEGDTLYEIATHYGTSLPDIVEVNSITNPDLIYPGQVLTILTKDSRLIHIVQEEDTLYEIATRYGISLTDIVEVNSITNPDLIHVGQVLSIPRTSIPTQTNTPTLDHAYLEKHFPTYRIIEGHKDSGEIEMFWREAEDDSPCYINDRDLEQGWGMPPRARTGIGGKEWCQLLDKDENPHDALGRELALYDKSTGIFIYRLDDSPCLILLPPIDWPDHEPAPVPTNNPFVETCYGQTRHLTCEAVAIMSQLRHYGLSLTENETFSYFPRNPDPEKGFRGNPDGAFNSLKDYGAHAPVVAGVINKILTDKDFDGSEAQYKYGADYEYIRRIIDKGSHVIVWISGKEKPEILELDSGSKVIQGEHVILVDGYKRQNGSYLYHVCDPWNSLNSNGRTYWIRGFKNWNLFDSPVVWVQYGE